MKYVVSCLMLSLVLFFNNLKSSHVVGVLENNSLNEEKEPSEINEKADSNFSKECSALLPGLDKEHFSRAEIVALSLLSVVATYKILHAKNKLPDLLHNLPFLAKEFYIWVTGGGPLVATMGNSERILDVVPSRGPWSLDGSGFGGVVIRSDRHVRNLIHIFSRKTSRSSP